MHSELPARGRLICLRHPRCPCHLPLSTQTRDKFPTITTVTIAQALHCCMAFGISGPRNARLLMQLGRNIAWPSLAISGSITQSGRTKPKRARRASTPINGTDVKLSCPAGRCASAPGRPPEEEWGRLHIYETPNATSTSPEANRTQPRQHCNDGARFPRFGRGGLCCLARNWILCHGAAAIPASRFHA